MLTLSPAQADALYENALAYLHGLLTDAVDSPKDLDALALRGARAITAAVRSARGDGADVFDPATAEHPHRSLPVGSVVRSPFNKATFTRHSAPTKGWRMSTAYDGSPLPLDLPGPGLCEPHAFFTVLTRGDGLTIPSPQTVAMSMETEQ